MTDNMKLWDAVSKTNPAHTKKVNQRGGFTSIDAQSQIMEATRQFGPIGIGWGYIASPPIFHERLAFVSVTLWHGERSNTFGPITGGAEWQSNKGHLDSDAIKKATTDGLTKLLAQLGFNADVFLGLFDDNKYLQQVTAEFAPKEAAISDNDRDDIITAAKQAGMDIQEVLKAGSVRTLNDINPGDVQNVINWIKSNPKKEA